MENQIETSTDKLLTFWNQQRKNIFIAFSAVLVLAGAWGIYYSWKQNKEQNVSFQVNRLQYQVLALQQQGASDITAQEQFAQLSAELMKLYEKNKSLVNGKRALFFSANLDAQLGQIPVARDKYLKLYKADAKHFLAPQALLFAALLNEEDGKIEEAIKQFQEFSRLYSSHFLYGEAQLSLGRNLVYNHKVEEAITIYDKLAKNKNAGVYAEKAMEQKRLLALRGMLPTQYQTPVSMPKFPGS
jgi:tetratricopeptide (TPR) repeat protein